MLYQLCFKTSQERAGRVAQVVESLPSKREALSSSSSTTKKTETENKKQARKESQ
jgi:hypothetical protein